MCGICEIQGVAYVGCVAYVRYRGWPMWGVGGVAYMRYRGWPMWGVGGVAWGEGM